MGGKTGIEWTDTTWNPVRGCSRVSEGCRHCYAEEQAARIVRMDRARGVAEGKGSYDGLVRLRVLSDTVDFGAAPAKEVARWTGEVRFVAERLADPLKWKKPRRIFVNSMSDLFHEKLSNEQIAAVFGVMAAAPQHTFQVLTKRARRMREWFEWVAMRLVHGLAMFPDDDDGWRARQMLFAASRRAGADLPHHHGGAWPLPNVMLGVSVENQEAADERIPELLATPAAVRFLSCEPLLGPVDLRRGVFDRDEKISKAMNGPAALNWHQADSVIAHPLDWVIAGCESGPGARPCDVEWLRSLRDQCAEAEVPFFLKQARHAIEPGNYPAVGNRRVDVVAAAAGSKRKPGGIIGAPYLDGVQHLAFPAESDLAQKGSS